MNFKRLTAFAVVATMVIGNCVTAFATDTTSTGSGIVEYDDSTDVEYDSVTVPTLVADSTYAFQIDPTGLLEEYGIKSDYENATVFFHKVKTQAKVEAAAENGHLYKEKYTEVTPTSNNYTGIATCTVEDDGTYTFSAVEDGYYLWVPDTAYQTGGVNKSGKYQAITKEDAAVYFDIPADNTITFRDDYKAGASPCNGKIYKREGEQADPITASYSEPITKWVTLSDQNAVTAVTGLWTDADLTTAAGVDDVKYTKAVYTYNSSTDEAYFINRSTKQKDITVKVTLENATGLTINNSTTFADDDNSASVYFAAMNGSTAVPLAVSNGVVSATFTATLAGATDAGETLYQTTSYNAAGGHKYGRFTGPAPTYTNHSFSIEAAANDNAGAVEAWKTYGASVTAETKPQLKIVYTYDDHSDIPVSGNGMVVAQGQDYDLTATFTKGTAYDINFTGVTAATWAATVDGEYAPSGNITVGTDKVTIAAGNWAAASVGSERFVKVSDGTNEYIIKFTIGGTVTGTGMAASSASNVDYTATFTKGTAYDISFAGVTTATFAMTVDGSYSTSTNITVGTDKVTIAAGNWAAANAGDHRYVKVSDGTFTYIIDFTVAE